VRHIGQEFAFQLCDALQFTILGGKHAFIPPQFFQRTGAIEAKHDLIAE
jgi:hypothetical protein